jgi:6-phosphogluconolactonase (cycloisomerase 2 family)
MPVRGPTEKISTMAQPSRRIATRRTARPVMVAVAFTLALTLPLTGCGNFFVANTTTTTTSTSTSTDLAYLTNSAKGTQYLNGYAVSSGTLAAANGSPYNLGFTPQSAVLSTPNSYLYIASNSTLAAGAIYGWSVAAGGALTVLNSGGALVSENSAALEVSTDGKYLFSLNSDGLTLEQYSINTSTGALGFVGNYPLTGPSDGAAIVPTALKMAPSGGFLVAVLGTGGAETFAYNTTTGALTASASFNPANTSIGIYGVAIDSNNNIYTAGTQLSNSPGLQEYAANSAGVPASTPVATATTGSGPRAVVLSGDGSYIYVANFTDGTISGFSTTASSGVLPTLTGSPYAAPSNVVALGRDNSGKYIVAGGYNATSGAQIYTIGSAGALASAAIAATGTSTGIPVSLAMAH